MLKINDSVSEMEISKSAAIKMHMSDVGTEDVHSITMFKDKYAICANPRTKNISVWDVKNDKCIQKWRTDYSTWSSIIVNELLVSGHGLIGNGEEENSIKIWDIEKGNCKATLLGHTDAVVVLKTTSDGKLISGSVDGTIKVWDLDQKKCINTLKAHSTSSVRAMTILSKYLVSAGHDEQMTVWALETGKWVKTIKNVGWIHALTATQDGLVVTGHSPDSKGISMQVWDIENGQCLQQDVKGHTASINALLTTHSGQVVSTSDDHTIKIWDISKKYSNCIKTISDTQSIYTIGLTSSGFIACNNENKSLEIWNLSSLKQDKEIMKSKDSFFQPVKKEKNDLISDHAISSTQKILK